MDTASSPDRRHHCPSCGVRTHSSFVGTDLKNDDVHYGICIKCNPKDVPASVRKEWKQKNPGVASPPRKPGSGNSKEVKPGSARNVAKKPAGAAGPNKAGQKAGQKPASSSNGSPKPGQKQASARTATSPKPPQKQGSSARPGPKPASAAGPGSSARNVGPKQASARAGSPKPGGTSGRNMGQKPASARAATATSSSSKNVVVKSSNSARNVNGGGGAKAPSSRSMGEKQESMRRHHCDACGIRTHMSVVGMEISNEDVYDGTCIKCNLDHVPAKVAKDWKEKQESLMGKEGHCDKCGIRTHRASGIAIKNDKVHFGTCIECHPEDLPSEVLEEMEKKDEEDTKHRCDKCGIKTHRSSGVAMKTDEVYFGTCIKCYPENVPSEVLEEMDKKDEEDMKHCCDKCGIKTHRPSGIAMKTDEVYFGTCIKCYPEKIPPEVFEEMEKKDEEDMKHRCDKCGIKTHRPSGIAMKTDEVYFGTCIKCHPEDLPPEFLEELEKKDEKDMKHRCDKCGIKTHRPSGVAMKTDEVHFGTCINCYPDDIPPEVLEAHKTKEAEDMKEMRHRCDKCGTRTHRPSGVAMKTDEVHFGTCINCYPEDIPPEVLEAFNEKEESNESQHHCRTCGIRTHSAVLGTELKNENVHHGTCIKCNVDAVPPIVRQRWKRMQNDTEEEEKKSPFKEKKSPSKESPSKGEKKSPSKDPNSPKPRLADEIIDKERRDRAIREGMCPDCFKVRTHNVTRFNREARKNIDVYYGVCIACHPDDPSIIPAARKAWEATRKDKPALEEPEPTIVSSPAPQDPPKDSTGAPVVSHTVGTGDKVLASLISITGSPTSPPVADSIIEKERREAIEKQGRCPDCGIMTHKTTRFSKEPLNNLDVHYGVCIRCNDDDDAIPPTVRKAWEEKQESSGAKVEKIDVKEGQSPEKPRAGMMQGSRFASVPMFAEDPNIKGLDPVLKAKVLTPVSLGWNKDEQHVFDHVIAFCSHAKRSKEEKREDKKLFGGIDRRVFSNLFVDDEPLVVAPNAELMGHAALFTEGLCAESFYMAAKCKNEWDARFIMTDLKKASHVEKYGHNRLKLSDEEKEKLIGYGANPADFKKVDDSGSKWVRVKSGHNSSKLSEEQKDKLISYGADPADFKKVDDSSGSKWLRLKSGKMPTRDDWYEVRHNVVLHILRSKFGGTRGTKTQKTTKALSSLISDKGEIPVLTEHRRKDAFWGDAKFGTGSSVLGKTITQVMLEITDKVHPARFLTKKEASAQLFNPNSEIVGYEWPLEETAESSDSN